MRSFLGAFVSAGLKMFIMATYSAWAVKLGLLDSDLHPLFALLMVPLSIYGLWVIVRALAGRVERLIEGDSEVEATS